MECLDKWYKKGTLTSAYESQSDSDNLQKGDNITSYISELEKRHKKLSKHGIVMPKYVLSLKLFNCAGHRDKQLALTAVDYSKPATMVPQMMVALRKFFGKVELKIPQQVLASPSRVSLYMLLRI